MARAINKSYIDVFDPKNRNIDGISAPSNNNLAFKLVGCLGPSPGANMAHTSVQICIRRLDQKMIMILNQAIGAEVFS